MRYLFLGLCLVLAGCARAPSEVPVAAPTPVTVSCPVERDVTDHADFTGRTAAVESVEVRARVSGYLDQVNFKEGALVKKDDKLFQIDPALTGPISSGPRGPWRSVTPACADWTVTTTASRT
jgi:multidrug efflux pump subunit AcrA (membrane-fusion protein)